ncbi:MAG TPA: type II toxin-antitoxin system RelE/ParE family toxin [Terriglobales bacterium]|nr:type II toxin-antitoxin system RelE/ParE family toxin [Terriglobales bacterium]
MKNKRVARFVKKNGISDTELCEAVERANRGLVDADLGGGVIKQRIARRGQGKSGGFRTVILFQAQQRAIFLIGFAKNVRQNITGEELRLAREAARFFLELSESAIDAIVATGELTEVRWHEKTLS